MNTFISESPLSPQDSWETLIFYSTCNKPEGHFSQHKEFLKIVYSSEDIRYTTKGNLIYATILGWPIDKKELLLTAFKDQNLSIQNISLMGCKEKITWIMMDDGLQISLPEEPVNEMAIVYKIQVKS